MLVTEKQKIDSFYTALVDRDPSYLGTFFVGVKTTSIFCISVCRAKKPKQQNVEFYTTFKEALDNGFNRVSIIIPCHRVIAKDGNLTGYGGGLERKRWLLQHEKQNAK